MRKAKMPKLGGYGVNYRLEKGDIKFSQKSRHTKEKKKNKHLALSLAWYGIRLLALAASY